tara:strand:+ start:131 stop:367 length:237 start_codon:yes stop_codon:yes gene_type:complete
MVALMNEQKTEIPAVCVRCGETIIITAYVSDLVKWHKGELIQDVLSYLNEDERELLISGTCGKCFEEIFPDNDLWGCL